MWCAMAECYEYLDQDLAAIKCYTRALLGSDQEKMALKKLPKLYKKIGDTEAAAHYFRKSLEQLREEQVRFRYVLISRVIFTGRPKTCAWSHTA
jgi:anaphase-promoting complex subunit 8